MSSHVVSKFHVDLMVRAAIHAREHGSGFRWWRRDAEGKYEGWYELDEFAEQRVDNDHVHYVTPSQAGQQLVNANVAGVHGRYPDDDPDAGELPGPMDAYYMGPYVYENPGITLKPGEVFQAIDYLDYQSCDIESWRDSDAFHFCEMLRYHYGKKVPGYGKWGYDGPEDFPDRPREFSYRIL